jgi:hypothetical protein
MAAKLGLYVNGMKAGSIRTAKVKFITAGYTGLDYIQNVAAMKGLNT